MCSENIWVKMTVYEFLCYITTFCKCILCKNFCFSDTGSLYGLIYMCVCVRDGWYDKQFSLEDFGSKMR